MSKLATLELTGKSGTKYTFDVYSYSSNFLKFGCVYCISKRALNDENKFVHDIFYIGKTEDMSIRISGHHKKECFEKNDPNCISIYKSESEEDRIRIEGDLIKYYEPTCND